MTYWITLRDLLGAVFVAVLSQLLLITLSIAIALLLVNWHTAIPNTKSVLDGWRTLPDFAVSFLTWAFLVTAIGCALTETRFTTAATDQIRRSGRSMFARNPTFAAKILMVQCSVAAAALAALGLGPPPVQLIEIGKALSLGQLVWSATLSVSVAALGSTARSAYKAFQVK